MYKPLTTSHIKTVFSHRLKRLAVILNMFDLIAMARQRKHPLKIKVIKFDDHHQPNKARPHNSSIKTRMILFRL